MGIAFHGSVLHTIDTPPGVLRGIGVIRIYEWLTVVRGWHSPCNLFRSIANLKRKEFLLEVGGFRIEQSQLDKVSWTNLVLLKRDEKCNSLLDKAKQEQVVAGI